MRRPVILPAGTVHNFAPKSISDHCAPSTSPVRGRDQDREFQRPGRNTPDECYADLRAWKQYRAETG